MNKNILIVDDSPSLRRVIKNYLSAISGASFFEASNGDEAQMIVQEQAAIGDPISLVMLDWMMPDVSGYDFLTHLRSIEAFAKAPLVVMLTAESYPEQVTAIMKYNVSAYLTKPFSQDELVGAVSKAFEGVNV